MMMMGEGELSSEEVEEANSMEPDERLEAVGGVGGGSGGVVDNQVG